MEMNAKVIQDRRLKLQSGRKFFTRMESYFMIAPACLLVLFMTVIPYLAAVVMTFFNYSLTNPEKRFVGLENYIRVLSMSDTWSSIFVSLKFLVVALALTITAALAFALILNLDIRFRAFFRSAFIFPWVISFVVAGLMFSWFFDEQGGIVNIVLTSLRIDALPWLSEGTFAFTVVVLCYVWKSFPFAMILFLAGLQGISKDYYEAVDVDGGGAPVKFFFVTVPFLKSQFKIVLVFLTIGILNLIDVIYAITNGGPGTSTRLISYYMYKQAFDNLEFSYSTTIGMIIILLTLLLTVVYLKVIKVDDL